MIFLITLIHFTGEVYVNILKEAIDPLITEIIQSDQHHKIDILHCHQNGAPPHYATHVKQFLYDQI